MRQAIIDLAEAEGDAVTAQRLKLPGHEGWPSQDELPYLAAHMGAQVLLVIPRQDEQLPGALWSPAQEVSATECRLGLPVSVVIVGENPVNDGRKENDNWLTIIGRNPWPPLDLLIRFT